MVIGNWALGIGNWELGIGNLTGSQALPGEPISRGSASSLPKMEAEPPDMRYQANPHYF